eukprot:352534-Chlamydomonas_euryale.AAC.6
MCCTWAVNAAAQLEFHTRVGPQLSEQRFATDGQLAAVPLAAQEGPPLGLPPALYNTVIGYSAGAIDHADKDDCLKVSVAGLRHQEASQWHGLLQVGQLVTLAEQSRRSGLSCPSESRSIPDLIRSLCSDLGCSYPTLFVAHQATRPVTVSESGCLRQAQNGRGVM